MTITVNKLATVDRQPSDTILSNVSNHKSAQGLLPSGASTDLKHLASFVRLVAYNQGEKTGDNAKMDPVSLDQISIFQQLFGFFQQEPAVTTEVPTSLLAMPEPDAQGLDGQIIPLNQLLSPLEIAELQEIEPAAGDTGSGGATSRFNSGVDAVDFKGLKRLGLDLPSEPIFGANLRTLVDSLSDIVPELNAEIYVNSIPLAQESILDFTEAKGGSVHTGRFNVDVGNDALAEIRSLGISNVSGNLKNGSLTSLGVPVIISLTENSYIGMAGDITVFTLDVRNDGNYTFSQFAPLDHSDLDQAVDVINMSFDVQAVDSNGDTVDTKIIINIQDGAPRAVADTPQSNALDVITGNFLSNDDGGVDGAPVLRTVLFGNQQFDVLPNAPIVINAAHGTLTVSLDGAYSYQPRTSLNTDNSGTDRFGYVLVDQDGDTSTIDPQSTDAVGITVVDGKPVVAATSLSVDETELRPGPLDKTNTAAFQAIILTGNIDHDYGTDGRGAGIFRGNNEFLTNGSLPVDPVSGAPTLTSSGVPVVVRYESNIQTYTGTAGADVVFRLKIDTDGSYVFRYLRNLDHGNANDVDDKIVLQFGVMASDRDGDITESTISISVADDGPVAINESQTINPVGEINGNLMANDYGGVDGLSAVSKIYFKNAAIDVPKVGSVNIDGDFGTLNVSSTGAYRYTPHAAAGTNNTGTDQFGYTVIDNDLDQSTMLGTNSSISFSVVDSIPTLGRVGLVDPNTSHLVSPFGVDSQFIAGNVIDEATGAPVVTGTYESSYGPDGALNISGNGLFTTSGSRKDGQLTSNDVPVIVTQEGDRYIGRAGATTVFTMDLSQDGEYRFTLLQGLDHQDGSNPDDVMTLYFGVQISDRDGDKDGGYITIDVKDDAPLAVGENLTSTVTAPISGNILSAMNTEDRTDYKGADLSTKIATVSYQGQLVNIPTTGSTNIVTEHGQLSIAANGAYIFQPKANGGIDLSGKDDFTYTIVDGDGDVSTAIMSITIVDGQPSISDIVMVADELSNRSVASTYTVDYGTDGAAQDLGKSIELVSGSFNSKNLPLTSGGQPIVVTQEGETLVGRVGTQDVFKIDIATDGQIQFNQFKQIDHVDPNNSEEMKLEFGIQITDKDGDTNTATVTINVKDDVPLAVQDTPSSVSVAREQSGNVITNDTVGFDTDVKRVSSVNGVALAGTGPVDIVGMYGTININPDGTYAYTADKTKINPGEAKTDVFSYTLTDGDGDTSSSTLNLAVTDSAPTINPLTDTVDESSAALRTKTGNINANYQGDGMGSMGITWDRASTALKSAGVNVEIIQDGHTITGKAGTGVAAPEVFKMVLGDNGNYTFNLLRPLDHPNKSDPNDTITLNFNTSITDADGDVATSTLAINVLDSVHTLGRDTSVQYFTIPGTVKQLVWSQTGYTYGWVNTDVPNPATTYTFTGTVIGNDTAGFDGPSLSYKPINEQGFQLLSNGDYSLTVGLGSYKRVVTYAAVDGDGDESTTTLNLSGTVYKVPPPWQGNVGGAGSGGGSGGGNPLVIDLDGDGLHLFSRSNGVLFDLTSDGIIDQTGWAGKSEAMLAHDLNNDGVINNVNELFGSLTEDGFTELARYDENQDGVISRAEASGVHVSGDDLTEIKLWIDANSNGITDTGELYTFEEKGLASISLDETKTDYQIEGNDIFYKTVTTFENGKQADIFSAWFQYLDGKTIEQAAIDNFIDESMALQETVGNGTYSVDTAAHIAATGPLVTTPPLSDENQLMV